LPVHPEIVAGVDLGSNSFHMIVARVDGGQLRIVDRLREPVRLASGLDKNQELTEQATERALACLTRFGHRVGELPPGTVRAAGTNTLRKAKNAQAFLERARTALGHPVDVIAGREEARLIYLGVSHGVPSLPARRLVIDIGGGSTECILGDGFDTVATESLYMGCVSYTSQFFRDGAIDRDSFRRAETAARVELQSLERHYRSLGWAACYGSSGTAVSLADALREKWSDPAVTRKGLKQVRAALCDAGHVNRVSLPGVDDARAAVLPGGLAILLAAFKSLEIQEMKPSSSALREGLLYDLLGRIRHEDVRERTITGLASRARVDIDHAARVERTAASCLDQVAHAFGLEDESASQILAWAARLHEIGLDISHTGFHKHSAYVIENADMPGFSRNEQQLLAFVVRAQRRKFPEDELALLPASARDRATKLAVLFRLACVLNRGRSTEALPLFTLEPFKNRLTLSLSAVWLDASPLIRMELVAEQERLTAAGIELALRVA
jgi:exopolyphosphatase/guanosine-5'-triphosphate,3'-diphosphate pyrophosphatase